MRMGNGTVPDAVIAVVPAKNSGAIGPTVAALCATGRVDRVVVVDDASTDDTAERAAAAGATVLSLTTNWGKGGAVTRAVEQFPEAAVYLLVDADLGETARHVVGLLDPVIGGTADLSIAVFPSAGGRGGFGVVKRAARSIIARECGYDAVEPLSGQRAVRGDLLRSLPAAPRFGLEVGMTVDAVRAGARLVEIEMPLDHEHTGRTLAGFRHRGGQAVDIVRAAAPRLGSVPVRAALMVVITLAVLVGILAAPWATGSGRPLVAASGRKVVLVTVADVSLADLDRGVLPNISNLLGTTGGALTPRTPAAPGDQLSSYASLGAGAPVVVADRRPGPVRALVRPTITLTPDGDGARLAEPVAVTGARNAYGTLGALGDALHGAGLRTGYVGARSGGDGHDAPGALAVADSSGAVDVALAGSLPEAEGPDLDAALGDRVAAVGTAMASSDVVLVDAGGSPLVQPVWLGPSTAAAREERHQRRLGHVRVADLLVGRIVAANPGALVVVAGVAPPSQWRLTPLAVAGDLPGALSSPSTRRGGLAALTDLGPTVLAAFGIARPDTMIGQRLTSGPDAADVAAVRELHDRTDARERLNPWITVGFILLQAVVYGAAMVGLATRRRWGRPIERLLVVAERVALACAAFPVVTFLYRLAPSAWQEPWPAAIGIGALSLAGGLAASRARHHPLSPLIWIAGVTVAVMGFDAATSGALQDVSLLGYSPVTAARFYGMGNMGFAVLGSATILLAGAWMAGTPRRTDGLVAIACLLAAVTTLEVAPDLGADFGGALVFVPTFLVGLVLWAGIRMNLGRMVRVIAASIAAVGAVMLVDRWTGSSHVAAFVAGGPDVMVATIARKLDANVRMFRSSTWTWMVPIIFGFFVWAATVGGGWRRWFGTQRVWRTTFLLLLGFGVLGGLMNDSGIAIPAMVLVYAGAFVLLLERKQPFAPPRVVGPRSATPAPSGAT